MKFNSIFKFILLLSISSGLYAQDFYTYKLFTNEFQAVFPGEPSMQQIPREVLDPKVIESSIPYEYRKNLTKKQIKKIVSNITIRLKSSQIFTYTDKTTKLSFISKTTSSEVKTNKALQAEYTRMKIKQGREAKGDIQCLDLF